MAQRIVVFGSTGGTGVEIVSQALARGWHVTAFARSQHTMAPHPQLNVVFGDILDAKAVGRVLSEAKANCIVSALGVRVGQPPGTVRSVGTHNIVRAMEETGVARLVVVSAVGVQGTWRWQSWSSRLLLPLIVGRKRLREADAQEAIISRSSLDWVLVRAPRLVDGEPQRVTNIGENLHVGLGSAITRKALAATLLDLAQAKQPSRKALIVLG